MKKVLKIISKFVILIIIIIIFFNVRIKNVEVIGSEKQDGERVSEAIFKNENDRISILFFIKDLMGLKKEVHYVDTYKVEWKSPVSIRVIVEEKPFIGFVKKDIINVYFDRDGIVSEMNEKRVKDVTEIRGINFGTFVKGEVLEAPDKRLFSSILDIINSLRNVGYIVSLIEVDRDDIISLYLGKIKVDIGNIEYMDVKIGRIIDIYPKIKDMSGTLDLSTARENMNDEQYIFKKS